MTPLQGAAVRLRQQEPVSGLTFWTSRGVCRKAARSAPMGELPLQVDFDTRWEVRPRACRASASEVRGASPGCQL